MFRRWRLLPTRRGKFFYAPPRVVPVSPPVPGFIRQSYNGRRVWHTKAQPRGQFWYAPPRVIAVSPQVPGFVRQPSVWKSQTRTEPRRGQFFFFPVKVAVTTGPVSPVFISRSARPRIPSPPRGKFWYAPPVVITVSPQVPGFVRQAQGYRVWPRTAPKGKFWYAPPAPPPAVLYNPIKDTNPSAPPLASDSTSYIFGLTFKVNSPGCVINGVWWYVSSGQNLNTNGHEKIALWTVAGALTQGGSASYVTGSVANAGIYSQGWNFIPFNSQIALTPGQEYMAVKGVDSFTGSSNYSATNSFFKAGNPGGNGFSEGPALVYSSGDTAGSAGASNQEPFTNFQQTFLTGPGASAPPDVTTQHPNSGFQASWYGMDIQISGPVAIAPPDRIRQSYRPRIPQPPRGKFWYAPPVVIPVIVAPPQLYRQAARPRIPSPPRGRFWYAPPRVIAVSPQVPGFARQANRPRVPQPPRGKYFFTPQTVVVVVPPTFVPTATTRSRPRPFSVRRGRYFEPVFVLPAVLTIICGGKLAKNIAMTSAAVPFQPFSAIVQVPEDSESVPTFIISAKPAGAITSRPVACSCGCMVE